MKTVVIKEVDAAEFYLRQLKAASRWLKAEFRRLVKNREYTDSARIFQYQVATNDHIFNLGEVIKSYERMRRKGMI